MVVPALPVANLVVGQTRFALGALDTFFDAVFGFGHAGELHGVSISSCVGQVVIGLDDVSGVTFPETDDNQDFCVTFLPLVRSRDHATLDHLDDERAFRAVAHIDLGPDAFADRSNPLVDARPWPLRVAPVTGVLRRFDFEVANLCVGRNGQQVLLVERVQTSAKPVRAAHFVVACDPCVRQCSAMQPEHFQAQLMACAIADSSGHARLLASLVHSWGRNSRVSTKACSLLETYPMQTATWQLSTLPSRPHHCRATPTDSRPDLGKPEGSKTITPSASPNCSPT